jgi:hypothetical protein
MLVLVLLEIVLTLMQDRCTVGAKRTIGSEIVLDAPDGTPRHCSPTRAIRLCTRRVNGTRCVTVQFSP